VERWRSAIPSSDWPTCPAENDMSNEHLFEFIKKEIAPVLRQLHRLQFRAAVCKEYHNNICQ
jgi:hypothetical protein